MIVADTNLVAYLILPGDHTAVAERVFSADPEWTAPLLWRSEFRNVVAYYMRHHALPVEGALEAVFRAEDLIEGHEYWVASAAVLELVSASTCSAYDCEFVAVAKGLDVPLITRDNEILSSFPEIAMTPEAFVS